MPFYTGDDFKNISNTIDLKSIVSISIDTNVYEDLDFKFDAPPLSRMDCFFREGISYVIVDVIEKEIQKRIEDKANSAKKNLSTDSLYGLEATERDKYIKKIDARKSNIYQEYLEHKEKFCIEVVDCDKHVKPSEILKYYFDKVPPFCSEKKYEFPDAFALITLEKYAKSMSKHIIIVSSDKGWHEYAKSSVCVHCFERLSHAQRFASELIEHFNRIVENALRTKSILGFDANFVLEFLNEKMEKIEVIPKYTSDFYANREEVKITEVQDFTINYLTLVNPVENEVEICVSIRCNVNISLAVKFSYPKMGEYTTNRNKEIELELYLYVNIDANENVTFSSCYLPDTKINVDFGEIEPEENAYNSF